MLGAVKESLDRMAMAKADNIPWYGHVLRKYALKFAIQGSTGAGQPKQT